MMNPLRFLGSAVRRPKTPKQQRARAKAKRAKVARRDQRRRAR